ncbi:phosphoadenosine phosphosulfate reductase domain-containing protein [Cochleicola gelatinilyticus]|uniref:Phosphoadenosine phosphosulphate reductase domain-containing protein n=1 Tax=Cochleicola gelatinilyticus TaxID=1763537 RepID=A0A167IK11_9FLAO|nr:phosphoadenosine phosphosulfate reductase family protein [Cochleicola gelatinilyticus]OAB79734.1 hypothetical protein ULVI_03035 [Cochleicola gelatinilyticus]
MKLIVPISGGKDSQATLLYCIEKFGVENIEAVFCDTKWEHELTYNHLSYTVEKSGVKFKVLSSNKYDGFVDLCKKKKRFPSSQVGFCTIELKVVPMIDYVLSLDENVMIFQGIRSDESKKRAQMNEECRYFKYYFQPYTSNMIVLEEFFKKPPITDKQKKKERKAIDRLLLGHNDEKFFTYRKKDVFKWCEKYSDDIHRPFFNSSAEDVIYYCLDRDYKINPLYFRGASRVGCFPCKNARHDEIQLIITEFPDTIEKIKKAEYYVEGTFFSPDYIPQRYHSGFDTKSGKSICTIGDVVKYITDKNIQFSLLEEFGYESTECKSVFNICE